MLMGRSDKIMSLTIGMVLERKQENNMTFAVVIFCV